MTQLLREYLEGNAFTIVLNGDNYGTVTLFRTYPNGVETLPKQPWYHASKLTLLEIATESMSNAAPIKSAPTYHLGTYYVRSGSGCSKQ